MDEYVMIFLVTEGYMEAAKIFRLESGTEPRIDIETIPVRMAVKNAVLDGNLEDAIEKINDLNPEILVTNPRLNFHLQQQRFIELIQNGKVEAALEIARKELAPIAEKNQHLLEELERTVLLFAFEGVANNPVSDLLDTSRRLKIAKEVNIAILMSQIDEKGLEFTTLLKRLIGWQHRLDEALKKKFPHK